MWCAGDGSATCGGIDAYDVYALDVPARPTMPGYLGCYADSKDDRVLQFEKMSDDMKPSVSSEGGREWRFAVRRHQTRRCRPRTLSREAPVGEVANICDELLL